jgi:mannose-1-phosphate guanylyltransferase
MFVFRAAALLDAMARYEPGLMTAMRGVATAWGIACEINTLLEAYSSLRRVSFDYGSSKQ